MNICLIPTRLAWEHSTAPAVRKVELMNQQPSATLLDPLKTLLPAQYKELLFRIHAPTEYFAADTAPPATQIIDLLNYAEQRPAFLQQLQNTLAQILGRDPFIEDHADIRRLPRPLARLVGRAAELQQLDQALFDDKVRVVVLEAGGGVGKSALSFAWLQAMQPDYHGYAKVFAWSFYSQDLHETYTSSAEFFQAALPFLGYTAELPTDDVEKGRALAQLLKVQPILLILDGLEPLQHPPQVLDGELKDSALKALLDDVYAQGCHGLVLVSSRQPVVELDEWDAAYYRHLPLATLPAVDGARLLTHLGVNGFAADLQAACEELGGHALALVLLGRLLKQRFNGLIERRDCLPPLWEEPKKGGHALRVLKFYETQGSESQDTWPRVQAVLFLLGLFDRPMGLLEHDALLKKADIAAPLRDLDELAWQRLEQHLEQAGLLLTAHIKSASFYDENNPAFRTEWDTHPLIRSYFGHRFAHIQPEAFCQAHQVLFEYYQAVPGQQQPDSLQDLQPLYRAVVHGCLAGEYKNTLYDVYNERIQRKKGYSVRELGAYSQNLTALTAFFPQGWNQPVQQGLSEGDQAWLLAVASFCLMSLGRLSEAVKPRQADLKLSKKIGDWEGASNTAQNLVNLYLPLGRVDEATQAAQQALDYAQQAEDLFEQIASQAYLGHGLHRQGEEAAALQAFVRAEALQAQRQPDTPQLYSLAGFLYCALLLDQAETAEAVQQVVARGEYALKIGKRNNHLLTIALDHLTLARAHWRLQQPPTAAEYFQQAVAGIRKASFTLYLPFFLIDRANFYLEHCMRDHASGKGVLPEPFQQAQADLQEAGNIIRRCGMKLYQVDWHLAMARLEDLKAAQPAQAPATSLPTPDVDAAQHRTQARDLIKLTGYKLRLKDV